MAADYVMVGGFLGAGKTTGMLRLAARFTAAGRRVVLITNDQSQGLVDTTLVAAGGYEVEEITGGCFCCRFNSLADASERLACNGRADVILAEPVGSCMDLRATVQHPLRRLYGDQYRVAPLSVVVDPLRAARMIGLESGRAFAPKIQYLYEKQLEEADLLVLNKVDLLAGGRRDALVSALAARFPAATVVPVSARTGEGVEHWFGLLSGGVATRPPMEVDYDLYAEGEAMLGWLNATVRLVAGMAFDGNRLLEQLAGGVRDRLSAAGVEIAHFKMTLTPEGGPGLGVANLVATDARLDTPVRLTGPLSGGRLTINLRAEADPNQLRGAVHVALDQARALLGVSAEVERSDHFRPGRPEPTYRFSAP